MSHFFFLFSFLFCNEISLLPVGLGRLSAYDRISDQISTLSYLNFRYDVVIDAGDVFRIKNRGVFKALYNGNIVRVSDETQINSDEIELKLEDCFYYGDTVMFQTGRMDHMQIVRVMDYCNQSDIIRKINMYRALTN